MAAAATILLVDDEDSVQKLLTYPLELDGLEVCKRLRATSAVPIIMLTARDDELDKVLGLELGADDYITKPFSIREFRSRVKALLRRASAPRPGERDDDEVIEQGELHQPELILTVRGVGYRFRER